MGQLTFYLQKIFQLFITFFVIIIELVLTFALPIFVMMLMNSKNQAYGWLYLISIPLGFAIIIVTIAAINWSELFDLDYYARNDTNNFDYRP
jgi:hypothetical protein